MSDDPRDPASYGDGCASFYDELYPTVEAGLLPCLRALAGSGPVLELGLATGRVAIPLAKAGVEVHGIEASQAMLAAFHGKERSPMVRAIHGDFATASYDTKYKLIFSLVSTFNLLSSRSRQESCLRSIAAHLALGGLFLSEAYADSQGGVAEPHEYSLFLSGEHRIYRVTMLATPLHVLDGLASSVGLHMKERWSDWRKTPFTSDSARHISLYGVATTCVKP